jgi:phage terminase large subunit
MINPVYVPAFKWRGRFLVLYGGSGSGKSWFVAQKLIVRLLKEDRHNILCVRNTATSVSKSQFPLLKSTIKQWGLGDYFTINEAPGKEKITCTYNGNQIIFSGLDDVEKLKSIFDITSVWIEEASEVRVEDFRELNRRLRGYRGKNKDGSERYMQIILSFNPISSLHWLKGYFFDQQQGDTLVVHSTYRDNKFIDANYAIQLEKLKDEDPYEYSVYALGQWGITGGTFFDGEKVSRRIEELRNSKPEKRGQFEYDYDGLHITNIRWVNDPSGYVTIYRDVEERVPYVIGGDTAGEGSDWNVAQVINNITGEQVAILRINYDEDLFARQEYCLGAYYNTALIGNESNFSTHPTKELERLQYGRHYIREQSPDAYTGKLTDRFGFVTRQNNRMDMLGNLRSIVREQPELINDTTTLYEMSTFIKNEKGKPEAADGMHDDCVISLAITHQIRGQQSMMLGPETASRKEKLIDRLKRR